MKIDRVSWVGVRVNNFEDTLRFYRDMMGLPLQHLNADNSVAMFVLPSGQYIEIFDADQITMPFEHLSFSLLVEGDLHEAKRELQAKGVTFISEIEESGDDQWAYFRAPDGSIVELGGHKRGSDKE